MNGIKGKGVSRRRIYQGKIKEVIKKNNIVIKKLIFEGTVSKVSLVSRINVWVIILENCSLFIVKVVKKVGFRGEVGRIFGVLAPFKINNYDFLLKDKILNLKIFIFIVLVVDFLVVGGRLGEGLKVWGLAIKEDKKDYFKIGMDEVVEKERTRKNVLIMIKKVVINRRIIKRIIKINILNIIFNGVNTNFFIIYL